MTGFSPQGKADIQQFLPYASLSQGLFMSNLDLDWQQGSAKDQKPPLSLHNVHINYETHRGSVQAVRGVTIDLYAGESLALIGESGSGKTTLGLAIIRLLANTAKVDPGQIIYRRDGREIDVLRLNSDDLRAFRWHDCAMVFQSALNAFNPVLRVWDQVWDTARAHGWSERQAVRERFQDLLKFVQLDQTRVINAYPHELSGGMRQRTLLAMSLLLDPQILILDEPTTALDILTQRTIIGLLRRLKEEQNFTMIFISHDLSIAAELADRVATMYAGRVVELGKTADIFYRPRHPYTLGLIRAVPTVTGAFEELASIPGSPPDLVNLPSGCKFHSRCRFATDKCKQQEPELETVGDDHFAACWHWTEVEKEIERTSLRGGQ
jgi:peptide/nickel transport system ATP-binding protein